MPSKKGKKTAHRRIVRAPKADTLNVEGIAALLTVSPDTVYDLLQSGELPGRKVGRQWRTTRNAVMRWLEQSMAAETAQRTTQAGDKAALRAIETGIVRRWRRRCNPGLCGSRQHSRRSLLKL
jgi:excisionase family DNA binding protein